MPPIAGSELTRIANEIDSTLDFEQNLKTGGHKNQSKNQKRLSQKLCIKNNVVFLQNLR